MDTDVIESPDTHLDAANGLSAKLRHLRKVAGLTLQQLSAQSGISVATLSKIENGLLSPTYEKIIALARGLNVNVEELFHTKRTPAPVGRRSITRRDQGTKHETRQYLYEVLHADLANKRFTPLVTTIKAHDSRDFPTLLRHEGEEFMYVLNGKVTVYSEFYAPLELESGDSCYFDSTMGHACISSGDEDAQVLWVCSNPAITR